MKSKSTEAGGSWFGPLYFARFYTFDTSFASQRAGAGSQCCSMRDHGKHKSRLKASSPLNYPYAPLSSVSVLLQTPGSVLICYAHVVSPSANVGVCDDSVLQLRNRFSRAGVLSWRGCYEEEAFPSPNPNLSCIISSFMKQRNHGPWLELKIAHKPCIQNAAGFTSSIPRYGWERPLLWICGNLLASA